MEQEMTLTQFAAVMLLTTALFLLAARLETLFG